MRYKCAFFDVDETIVSFKTMFDFLGFFYKETEDQLGVNKFNDYMDKIHDDWRKNRSREAINREYYEKFSGVNVYKLEEIIQNWYLSKTNSLGNDFYISPVVDEIKNLKDNGTSIVLVSGSLLNLISHIGNYLGVSEILATKIESIKDTYTGNIIPPQTIGDGKALAIKSYMQLNGINPEECIAYGDHMSDFQMLSCVQDGVIVSKDSETLFKARSNGWRVITEF